MSRAVGQDAARSARLVFAHELTTGAVSQADVERDAVAGLLAPQRVPPSPVRFAQRLLQKTGRLTYYDSCVAPVMRARSAVLGTDAASGPPRFLVRVDEFPHYEALDDNARYGSAPFMRFHETMLAAGVPYLIAVTPRLSHAPLDPHATGGRPLIEEEREVLARLHADGITFGLHGYDHRTRALSPRRRSEIAGLTADELRQLLDRAHAELATLGIDPRVFVPPYNRFDRDQFDVLAERYDVVCGGPENVPLMGLQRTPQWRGDAVFLPSYPPLYDRASAVLPAVEEMVEANAPVWAPITLHWGWEADDGWGALERLAERIARFTARWDDFLDAVRATR